MEGDIFTNAIKAIRADDLQSFKAIYLGMADMHRPISPRKPLIAFEKDETLPYSVPHDINIPGYAIMCHAVKIVKYLLHENRIRCDIRCSGMNLVHLAAIVDNREMLSQLIRHSWVQLHLADPIQCSSNDKTNALHLAIAHGRLYNAYLLVSPLPSVEYGDLDADVSGVKPIPIDTLTTGGQTILGVAVNSMSLDAVKFAMACQHKFGIPSVDEYRKLRSSVARMQNMGVGDRVELEYIIQILSEDVYSLGLGFHETLLELGLIQLEEVEPPKKPEVISTNCKICGLEEAEKCEQCGWYFCPIHFIKAAAHSCHNK